MTTWPGDPLGRTTQTDLQYRQLPENVLRMPNGTQVVWRETQNYPRLNEQVPDFTAKSTKGEITLSDLRGKWVCLFSHPADFTPVCTTELIAFARHYQDFQKQNCQLIGLSVDSVYSHIAWIRNIEQNFGINIPYPLISDSNTVVSRLYGMIHPAASDTATVRTTFIIDDSGLLRCMLHYPMNVGRNVEEILRTVTALQVSAKNNVDIPESWHPGEKYIVPAPTTQERAQQSKQEGYEYTDWYFVKAESRQNLAA